MAKFFWINNPVFGHIGKFGTVLPHLLLTHADRPKLEYRAIQYAIIYFT